MRPVFQIIAGNQDITEIIADRLLSIEITDKTGIDSDECSIAIDDRDGRLEFPARGMTLFVALGYAGQPLCGMGAYVVDEVEVSSSPDTVTLRCSAADMRNASKSQRAHSWENVTLSDVVNDIAQRNGWQPVCQIDAELARVDQLGESDVHFIQRIAKQHDGTATVKDGKLLVMPRGGGKRSSGVALPMVTFQRADLHSYKFTFGDRGNHSGTRAAHHDNQTGQLKIVEIGNPSAAPGAAGVHADRHIYVSESAARAAAQSRMQALNRATAKGQLELKRGDGRVCADMLLQVAGIKFGVDGIYLIESVTHRYDKEAWQTSIELNAGNEGKAKVGHESKGLRIVELDKPKN